MLDLISGNWLEDRSLAELIPSSHEVSQDQSPRLAHPLPDNSEPAALVRATSAATPWARKAARHLSH
jgi:hypothetical protein